MNWNSVPYNFLSFQFSATTSEQIVLTCTNPILKDHKTTQEIRKLHFKPFPIFSSLGAPVITALTATFLLHPSIQAWMGKPKGLSLSYPSQCQVFNHSSSRNANALHLESVPNVSIAWVYSYPAGSQVHLKDLSSHLELNLRRSLYSFPYSPIRLFNVAILIRMSWYFSKSASISSWVNPLLK